MTSTPILILGAGYTGRYVYALAKEYSSRVLATSRHPEKNLLYVRPDERLFFDLEQYNTWATLPLDCHVLWCFPACPLELVKRFADQRSGRNRRLIVMGSTSAYDGPSHRLRGAAPWIDESAAIDPSIPRVQGEEYLRGQHGAVVLRVAGIYGPGRNPLDWIRQQRVGRSDRYVNLIHVADLAEICLELLGLDVPGEIFNVSDGTPRTWAEICAMATTHWGIIPRDPRREGGAGKRISTHKLRTTLNYHFRHPNVFEALTTIEPLPLKHMAPFQENTEPRS